MTFDRKREMRIRRVMVERDLTCQQALEVIEQEEQDAWALLDQYLADAPRMPVMDLDGQASLSVPMTRPLSEHGGPGKITTSADFQHFLGLSRSRVAAAQEFTVGTLPQVSGTAD